MPTEMSQTQKDGHRMIPQENRGTESRMAGARVGGGERWELLFTGGRVLVWEDETVLEMVEAVV